MLQRIASFNNMDRLHGVWHDPYVRLPYWKWPCKTVVHMHCGEPTLGMKAGVITSYRLNEFGLERYARFYRNVTDASQRRVFQLSHHGKISLNWS